MPKYIFLFTLFVANIAHAQQPTNHSDSLNGLIVYQQKINMVSPAVNYDTLMFNRTKSIFEWNLYTTSNEELRKAKQKYPNAKVVNAADETDGKGQVLLLDTAKDSIFSRMNMRFIGKLLYLKEEAPEINWTIADSTKMVGNYITQRATTHFRGRKYTAWFTPKIPLPFGPWKLHGLPGLILQAYDQTGNIYFSATNITLMNVDSVGPITLNGKEKQIALDEYKDITKNFKKLHKRATLKKIRGHVSKEDLANMTFDLPDIGLMENFEENSKQ